MKQFTNNANETHQVPETLGDRMYLATKVTNMLGIEGLIQDQIASYSGTVSAEQKQYDCYNILLSAPVRMIITRIYKELETRYCPVS